MSAEPSNHQSHRLLQAAAEAQSVRTLVGPAALRAALGPPGGDALASRGLLVVLEGTASLLRDLGAPARVKAALAAQSDVRRALGVAGGDRCACTHATLQLDRSRIGSY